MCQTISCGETHNAITGGPTRLRRRRTSRHGFTLVEAAMATAVVGMALAGLLHAMGAGDMVNGYGRDLTSAAFLAGEVREYTLGLAFSDPDGNAVLGAEPGESTPDDVDDIVNASYSPPIDGAGRTLSDMADWRQDVTIEWVSLDDFAQTVTAGTTQVVRITTVISHNGSEITRATWLKFGGGGA